MVADVEMGHFRVAMRNRRCECRDHDGDDGRDPVDDDAGAGSIRLESEAAGGGGGGGGGRGCEAGAPSEHPDTGAVIQPEARRHFCFNMGQPTKPGPSAGESRRARAKRGSGELAGVVHFSRRKE